VSLLQPGSGSQTGTVPLLLPLKPLLEPETPLLEPLNPLLDPLMPLLLPLPPLLPPLDPLLPPLLEPLPPMPAVLPPHPWAASAAADRQRRKETMRGMARFKGVSSVQRRATRAGSRQGVKESKGAWRVGQAHFAECSRTKPPPPEPLLELPKPLSKNPASKHSE
jgi:hypothetical protein